MKLNSSEGNSCKGLDKVFKVGGSKKKKHQRKTQSVDIVHLGATDAMGGGHSSPTSSPGGRSGNGNGGNSNGKIDAVGPMRRGAAAAAVSGAPRRPMPDEAELERRFNEVLVQMDLPPERAKHLKGFDAAKKWEIVCDQEQVHARDPPGAYLAKIRTYLDPHASKSSRKIRSLGDSTSTQVLRNLEISLRTNNIEWVREFLHEENRGLDVLVDYLSGRLIVMRHTMCVDELGDGKKSGTIKSTSSLGGSGKKGGGVANTSANSLDFDSPRLSKMMRQSTKLKMGDTTDDIHVCIMCLRAIMNNKFGFNMVIQHKQAINCIALSLIHRKLRTKALVLELLAAICLAVKGGHDIILAAFDSFKRETGEARRFETLMRYFVNPDAFQIEFMVACMQFVNIVVHSVEDMNFRVALQWEFSSLGLDDCLERLKHHESEELSVQISAYVDNEFDVSALMEEAEAKAAALERVHELEDEVGRVNELLQELEVEAMARQVEMENQLEEVRRERDQLSERSQQVESEYSTLRKTLSSKEEDSKRRQSMLEEKIKSLEAERSALVSGGSSNTSNTSLASVSTQQMAPPPPPAPAPPPPPPPPGPPPPPSMMGGPPPPPPPLGGMAKTDPNLTIRRAIQTTYKLPTMHWVALKPNDTKDTIWYLMDDMKLMKDLDFASFEEEFKLSPAPISNNNNRDEKDSSPPKKAAPVKQQHESLLEHTRLKNMAICKRKLPPNLDTPELVRCVNALDIQTLSAETVELLQRMVPLEAEVKAYRDYNTQKKDVELLTEEDRLMRQFACVERFGTKLQIMAFMSSFEENLKNVRPQVNAIALASKSLRNSRKVKRMLELILAFGNYMNSTKKGPCYGFKLQSLDSMTITKSKDKKQHLVHYLAELVREKYPDLSNFYAEANCVDKASQYSVENMLTDVKELEKGMEVTRKELEHRLATPNAKDRAKMAQNQTLRDFVDRASEQMTVLRQEADRAESLFKDCVEYFGENPKMVDASTFFGYFVRFIATWKQSEMENEKRRKLQKEEAVKMSSAANTEDLARKNMANRKNLQNQLISEFKSKSSAKMKPEEVKDGTLEDIIMGLKSEPYRANGGNEAMRKSFRRQRSEKTGANYVTTNHSEEL